MNEKHQSTQCREMSHAVAFVNLSLVQREQSGVRSSGLAAIYESGGGLDSFHFVAIQKTLSVTS